MTFSQFGYMVCMAFLLLTVTKPGPINTDASRSTHNESPSVYVDK